ncbi:hypothetical protein CYMTET_54944 [Cymbomonas tetramitiformis]|uniref:Uncharacterized protein n=1 Tax=Cymbomonas tetramitiformis TaxID=36881 RepID=A0AAE0ENU9_9CHLO|nr:hypothetical protein CYMTET_54944 [Cymbomonas tetramitiformis]
MIPTQTLHIRPLLIRHLYIRPLLIRHLLTHQPATYHGPPHVCAPNLGLSNYFSDERSNKGPLPSEPPPPPVHHHPRSPLESRARKASISIGPVALRARVP